MNNKSAWLLLILATIVGVLAGAGWYQSRVQLRELRVAGLSTIVASLKEDQDLLKVLQTDGTQEKGPGILGSYLAAIRADGVVKHADIKQRLDRLAENNAAILALINLYSTNAKTAAFRAEASRFQRYAIAWRDRWNSVMELFMAGGNYPTAEAPFPAEFAAAVEAEIAAEK